LVQKGHHEMANDRALWLWERKSAFDIEKVGKADRRILAQHLALISHFLFLFSTYFCRSTQQQGNRRRQQQSERLQNGRERNRRPKSDGVQHADSSIMEDDVSSSQFPVHRFGFGSVMIVLLDQRHCRGLRTF